MAQVEIKNLTKIYPGAKEETIKDANMLVHDEEFVVLVGPSGCGKSTLLRMIAGLEEITGGDLHIDGKRVNDISPKDRDIAMVFQNYALYPHMTVFDNMAFGLKLRKLPKREIKVMVENAARILDISHLLDRRPKAMSGGQRQRVAIGRAIVRDPKVFLFDEPLSNLDAKLRVQMRTEIKRLHKQLKATMIYVTHDQIEAMTMGDRIVILKDGVIQQFDSPMNLFNNPQNKFVAGFIGSPPMNFQNGKIEKNGALKFKSSDFNFPIPDDFASPLKNYSGREVVLGFRPEYMYDVKLDQEHILTSPQEITLDLIEPIGSETYVYFTAGGYQNCFRSSTGEKYLPGQKIQIGIEQKSLRFFDADTELRII